MADGGFRGQRVCRDSRGSRGNEGSRLIGAVSMAESEKQRQCPLCVIPPQADLPVPAFTEKPGPVPPFETPTFVGVTKTIGVTGLVIVF